MKLLLDANLSYRLVKKLTAQFSTCLHVTRTGLPIPAEDIAIKTNGWVIVTNDDDYYNLSNTYGFPPNVVLLRMGNQSSTGVMETLQKHYDDIQKLDESDEFGLLELF